MPKGRRSTRNKHRSSSSTNRGRTRSSGERCGKCGRRNCGCNVKVKVDVSGAFGATGPAGGESKCVQDIRNPTPTL